MATAPRSNLRTITLSGYQKNDPAGRILIDTRLLTAAAELKTRGGRLSWADVRILHRSMITGGGLGTFYTKTLIKGNAAQHLFSLLTGVELFENKSYSVGNSDQTFHIINISLSKDVVEFSNGMKLPNTNRGAKGEVYSLWGLQLASRFEFFLPSAAWLSMFYVLPGQPLLSTQPSYAAFNNILAADQTICADDAEHLSARYAVEHWFTFLVPWLAQVAAANSAGAIPPPPPVLTLAINGANVTFPFPTQNLAAPYLALRGNSRDFYRLLELAQDTIAQFSNCFTTPFAPANQRLPKDYPLV